MVRMGDTEPVKVVIRGVEYPSIRAAAKALGISRQAVHQGLTVGRIDNVGLKKAKAVKVPDLHAALLVPEVAELLAAIWPIWQALTGPDHWIREIQAIARLPGTPMPRLYDAIIAMMPSDVDDKKPTDPVSK